jgi:hypothetical protein
MRSLPMYDFFRHFFQTEHARQEGQDPSPDEAPMGYESALPFLQDEPQATERT